MRNLYLFLLIAVFTGAFMSAQVKIGENPQNIDPSSVLELESTDKVLVITRVTTAQMNAIVPIQGALCYNTDLQSVHYYDGSQWVNIGDGGTGGPLTADAIVNPEPTIVISPTATGDNLEVLPESITGAQIKDGQITGTDMADGSIGPGKLQDQSVTIDKLSENSVGAFALDNDSFGVSAFNNDVGYITAADVNIVSPDVGNAISPDANGAAFYDDTDLLMDVSDNAAAIALDNDQNATNELQNLIYNTTTNILTLTTPATAGNQVDLSGLAGAAGNPIDELIQDGEVIGNDLIINEGVGANAQQITIDVSTLVGGTGGSTELVDGTTLIGTGIATDRFRINPSITVGQYLRTTAAGVVWDDLPTGTGGSVASDGMTIVGDGADATTQLMVPTGGITTTQIFDGTIATIDIADANVTPIKIEPSATVNQVLTTTAAGTVWADLPPSGGAALFDANTISGTGTTGDEYTVADDGITTVKILDANVTPVKIEPSATVNQVLTTTAAGTVWADLPPSGGAALFDANTISGTGTIGDEYTVADDGITTVKILDANVTPVKIEPSATVNQVLTTTAAGTVWADLPPSGGAALFDVNTISGTGTTGDEYTVADDGITTLKILDANVTPIKIEPSATVNQVLTTTATGTVWADLPPSAGAALFDANTISGTGTAGDEYTVADDGITTIKILDANVTPVKIESSATVNQVLTTTAAGTVWADLPPVTAPLFDVNTISGTGTAGDEYTVADDGITTIKILDANVTPVKIEPSATVNQVLTTTAAGTVWADLPPVTAPLFDVNTISGTGTAGDEYTVADDGITTTKIANATILAEDLNDMGATADGDILKWNTALNAGAGGWETGANAGHTGTTNEIFFADDNTGAPTSTNGFIWNPTAINSAFPALGIGLDGVGVQSAKAKVHIMENYPLTSDPISYGIQLQNRSTTNNTAVGMIFSVDEWTTSYGKGALVFERTGNWAIGDFHFLQNNTTGSGTDVNPTLADKAFTVTKDKDLGIYRAIGVGATGADFGLNNQVLASGGPGNPVKWVNNGGLPTGTANNQVIKWNNTSTAWELGTDNGNHSGSAAGSVFFAGAAPNFEPTDNNAQLFWDNTNNRLGIGTNTPTNKFHVTGAVRTEGILNSDGDDGEPSYRFNGDTNTGMFLKAADDIGFTAGGAEAMSVTRPTPTAETRVIINENLELSDALLDKDGDAGTAGQVLTSTGGANPQTNWVNSLGGPTQKEKVLASSPFGTGNGAYTVPVTGQSTVNYVINISVQQTVTLNPIIIQIVSQSLTQFEVQILQFDAVAGNFVGVNADWHYTIYNP